MENKPTGTSDGLTVDAEVEVRRCYAAVRTRVSANLVIVVLHVGAEKTGIAIGNAQTPAIATLEVGSKKTARDYFQHAPPTPVEMETAIAAVEDQVMRVRAIIQGGAAVFTTDADIREIALAAGVPAGGEMTLSRDAIEQTFERLLAVVLGKSALGEGIPRSNEFAATLLILRELMHHLQFQSLTLL